MEKFQFDFGIQSHPYIIVYIHDCGEHFFYEILMTVWAT